MTIQFPVSQAPAMVTHGCQAACRPAFILNSPISSIVLAAVAVAAARSFKTSISFQKVHWSEVASSNLRWYHGIKRLLEILALCVSIGVKSGP